MRDHDEETRVVYVERDGGSGFKTFLLGAAIGAVLTYFYTPQSGEESRREMQKRLRKLRAAAEERAEEIGDQVSQGARALRQNYEAAKDRTLERVESGVKKAGNAVDNAREELERRLQEARARRNPAAHDEDEEPTA